MKLTPAMRRILIALDRDGDMQASEIAENAYVSPNTLSGGGYLTKLLTMRLIRVSRWMRQEGPGPFVPVYSVSPGENKPKPRPYTPAQKTKRWRIHTGYRSAAYKQRQALDAILRIAK